MRSAEDRRTLDTVGSPVFLCGMMGAGKSTVGRALAERLGAVFIDLDARIERMFGATIPEAFAQGEPFFRTLEGRALQSLLDEPAFCERAVVVATGGGAVLTPENRGAMDAVGSRVLLRVSPEELVTRLSGPETQHRPLIANSNDPAQSLRSLWEARREAYEEGAMIVDAEGPVEEVVDRVLSALDQTR